MLMDPGQSMFELRGWAVFSLAVLLLGGACGSQKDDSKGGPADAASAGGSGGDLGGSGGTLDTGGGLATGGSSGLGGDAGPANGTGGNYGKGGTSGTNLGTGGVPTTGGRPSAGGVHGTGGVQNTGGLPATGGKPSTGGVQSTGGLPATGGKPSTGGVPSTGGQPATGGKPSTGGVQGTGGRPGTGGTLAGGTGGVQIPPGAPGNPDGHCAIPAEAQLEDVSVPTTVVGTGTPASCTAALFVAAVAKGGIITFDCGPDPATITLTSPAKVFNDKGPRIVIDGGGKVTLSGGGTTRILYMNTCDENQVWTSSRCDNQATPQLTVQNLTFVNANSKNETKYDGGGAIYASGGRLKVINSRFTNNVCADSGPDVGGAAIRAFQQYNGLPVYVVNSTFGGADGAGNVCSNGGGISSIGVSWTILNSLFSYNQAIGNGGNPADPNTPGGGSGGAIYNDGNTMTLSLCGTRIEYNQVKAYGSAIFFVTNDHSGNVVIDSSVITNNLGGSWYPTYPQISNHDDTPITVTSSTIK